MSHSDKTVRSYGYIFNTRIDMNNKPLINLPAPVNDKDPITGEKLSILINILDIYLEDIPIKISDASFGSFFITVNGLFEYYPNSSFFISKNNSNKISYPCKISCSKGEPDTYINIEWKSNDGIYITKSNNSYNGRYVIKIL